MHEISNCFLRKMSSVESFTQGAKRPIGHYNYYSVHSNFNFINLVGVKVTSLFKLVAKFKSKVQDYPAYFPPTKRHFVNCAFLAVVSSFSTLQV